MGILYDQLYDTLKQGGRTGAMKQVGRGGTSDWWKNSGYDELQKNLTQIQGRASTKNPNQLAKWLTTQNKYDPQQLWWQPQKILAGNYADAGGTAPKAPVFGEVLPYEQAWGTLKPSVQQEANQQVNPSIQRGLSSQLRNLNLNLAGSGAGRFGRALGQGGDLKASAEQDRKAQVIDWMTERENQFNNLWYKPTQESWTSGMTQGNTQKSLQDQLRVPTWDDFVAGNYGENAIPTSPTTPLMSGITQGQARKSLQNPIRMPAGEDFMGGSYEGTPTPPAVPDFNNNKFMNLA